MTRSRPQGPPVVRVPLEVWGAEGIRWHHWGPNVRSMWANMKYASEARCFINALEKLFRDFPDAPFGGMWYRVVAMRTAQEVRDLIGPDMTAIFSAWDKGRAW